ncbi:DUF1214 domain-containing protein [bacterium]|nr:DUF1214 domain-containing protein [bacterium]
MAERITAEAARALAVEAYTYGFAMVESYKAIFAMCVWTDAPTYSGFNNYLHGRVLFDSSYDTVVNANNDTLYSTTFADLRREPIVVSVPPTGDRYFVIQLVDMGTDNFAYIGTRATGRDGGDFLLVGPRFKGPVDAEGFTRVIHCPSDFVALATRTAIDGADDLPGVIAVQDRLAIRPQSAFSATEKPPAPAAIDWPPYTSDVYRSPKLFELLNFLLPFHVAADHERKVLDRISHIGVGPHRTFDLNAFDTVVAEAIAEGVAEAHAAIEARANSLGTVVDGWQDIPPMGTYGDDYLFRSAVAWKFIYTNSPEEALYPIAETDADGAPLSGANDYVIHFDADRLPPVDAFWSITLYGSETRLMIDNPIDRYSIGDRTPGLRYGDDGSLTIRIQQHPPDGSDVANWLPAPAERFYLNARAYLPDPEFLDGTYRLPPVQRLADQAEPPGPR